MDCIFCKILKGEIPSKKVYENNMVYAFHDINPVAPVHVIVIPKEHITSVNDINSSSSEYVKCIFEAIPEIANQLGVKEDGYRVITNIGENGGQSVKHLHFHIIGGTKLGEKLV